MKTNRYRFKSRTKQIKEADVGVVSNLSKENAVSLNDILARDSDQSEAFKNIKKNILPLTHSLPVLIYNLPKVMLIFAENIEVCPLSGLAALQALAREVRYELAPFFDNLLGIFIGLVKRIDLLEEIFNCLSVCLKYAIKNLNPREVLYKAKDLINHDNDGVRHLAAQSFAFLVKKAGPDVLGDLLKD